VTFLAAAIASSTTARVARTMIDVSVLMTTGN
jgi:hypothetical protein